MLDIVIPVWNEEKILLERREYFQALQKKTKIIFVDGDSSDQTVTVARNYGMVVPASRGRGLQKNEGAKRSSSGTILFLHVDTVIDGKTIEAIEKAVHNGALAGCLTLMIDDNRWIFRFYEWLINQRARRRGVVDGDLGMFIRKDIFEKLGGFEPLPLMEDIDFSKRLKNAAAIVVLDRPIVVSSRKWNERGFFKTLGAYTLAYIRFWMGLVKAKPGETV